MWAGVAGSSRDKPLAHLSLLRVPTWRLQSRESDLPTPGWGRSVSLVGDPGSSGGGVEEVMWVLACATGSERLCWAALPGAYPLPERVGH